MSFHDGSNMTLAAVVANDRATVVAEPATDEAKASRATHIVGAMDALAKPRLDVGAEAKLTRRAGDHSAHRPFDGGR